jgi:uncharacterized protein YndB with AHSA1/START domain
VLRKLAEPISSGDGQMTVNEAERTRVLGSLRSGDGKGIVRMEGRLDTTIDDVWSALTDPSRLARWYGKVEGDLRLGGEFRSRLFASGWEGTGRVEACEPRHLLVVTKSADHPDEEHAIEVTLAADGDRTVLVLEERGMPLELLAAYGAGCKSTSKTSSTISPGMSAATQTRAGTNCSLPTTTWPPTSARRQPRLVGRWGNLPVPPDPLHRSGFAGRTLRACCARAHVGGGGNRTLVRGRTGQSIYRLSSRLEFRPDSRLVSSTTVGLAILWGRASGDWLSLGAEPVF